MDSAKSKGAVADQTHPARALLDLLARQPVSQVEADGLGHLDSSRSTLSPPLKSAGGKAT